MNRFEDYIKTITSNIHTPSYAKRFENVVEVVRCKDCKYYGSKWWMGDCHLERWGDGWGNYPSPTVTEDGFCAWGERKEDE